MNKTVEIGLVVPNQIAMRCVDRESEEYIGLVASVRRIGNLNKISVRVKIDFRGEKYYEIVDGLHRYSAMKDCGFEEIDVQVIDISDDEVLEAQIMASVHKVETKPHEYALQLKRMLARNPTMTMVELSDRLGKSTIWLSQRLSLTKIRDYRIRDLINDGKINLSNAYGLAKLPRNEQGNFVDRAMTMQFQEFGPMVTTKVKNLRDATRSARPVAQIHDEQMFAVGQNALGATDLPACVPVDLTALRQLADSAIAMSLAMRNIGKMASKPKGIEIPLTNYELLHGRKELTPKTITEIVEAQPLRRKGWDVVHNQSYSHPFAYCAGDWLVRRGSSGQWLLNNPQQPRLFSLRFDDAEEAMAWIEKNFNV